MAARIERARDMVDPVAIHIESREITALVVARVRLEPAQGGFIDEAQDLKRPVMPPEANAASRRIETATSVGEAERHRRSIGSIGHPVRFNWVSNGDAALDLGASSGKRAMIGQRARSCLCFLDARK